MPNQPRITYSHFALVLSAGLSAGFAVAISASIAQAQTVGMVGHYSENGGPIFHLPQNPPNIPCVHLSRDARCVRSARVVNGGPQNVISQYPHHGVYGARIVGTDGVGPGLRGLQNGLNVGDPFVVPPLLMQQRLGQQVGIILNNFVRQIDTTFTASAPAPQRLKNPPVNTRRFSAKNWSLDGAQNNGLTGTAAEARLAHIPTVARLLEHGPLVMTYKAGPNQFGGTMATLLEGAGRSYIHSLLLNAGFPAGAQPSVGTSPIGNAVPGAVTRNGAGWDYTVRVPQNGGLIKAYGPALGVPASIRSAILGPPCSPTPPPSPEGCNEVNGFDTYGVVVVELPGATSTRHLFAWTTGTVTIALTADRSRIGRGILTDTLTGMGYDTVTYDGTVPNRRVGLVAGSYTIRTDGLGTMTMTPQIIGIDFKFAPEPSATLALISGLGLLGALASTTRRRHSIESSIEAPSRPVARRD